MIFNLRLFSQVLLATYLLFFAAFCGLLSLAFKPTEKPIAKLLITYPNGRLKMPEKQENPFFFNGYGQIHDCQVHYCTQQESDELYKELNKRNK